jgi:tellurite methyltransferase
MTAKVWEWYWSNTDKHKRWKQPAPEVLEFIRSLSPMERPRILDWGCGLGRHSVAFALAGFQVTSADASSAAINHVDDWAKRLNLAIETKVCDTVANNFPAETFDIVLSYNVIYHGFRHQFKAAIRHIHQVLKRKGIFFFTCPTRRDGKYGYGEMVAPHTYRCSKSITPGDIHYFVDERDLDEMLIGFQTIKRWRSEGYWDNEGEQQFYSSWHVQVQKI